MVAEAFPILTPMDASEPNAFSVDFLMFCYKVDICPRKENHDWATCPYAHAKEKARRRDPARYAYTSVPCAYTMQGGTCPRGDLCPYSHSLYEYWLHPDRFRTQMCKYGAHCNRPLCFFAHRADELRFPDADPDQRLALLLMAGPQQPGPAADASPAGGCSSPTNACDTAPRVGIELLAAPPNAACGGLLQATVSGGHALPSGVYAAAVPPAAAVAAEAGGSGSFSAIAAWGAGIGSGQLGSGQVGSPSAVPQQAAAADAFQGFQDLDAATDSLANLSVSRAGRLLRAAPRPAAAAAAAAAQQLRVQLEQQQAAVLAQRSAIDKQRLALDLWLAELQREEALVLAGGSSSGASATLPSQPLPLQAPPPVVPVCLAPRASTSNGGAEPCWGLGSTSEPLMQFVPAPAGAFSPASDPANALFCLETPASSFAALPQQLPLGTFDFFDAAPLPPGNGF